MFNVEDLNSYLLPFDLFTFVGVPKTTIIKRAKEICVKIIRKVLGKVYIQISRYNLGVNAEYVNNSIIDWIKKNSNEPFFIWSHFLDIHNSNCVSGKIGFPPGYTELYGKRLKLGKKYYGSLQYDFSVRYVDEKLRDIIDFLKHMKLLKKTLIVVCGDHGTDIAGMPKRCLKNPVGSFYEELTKIPLVFYNPNLKPRPIQNLCTTLDIAPTILDLMDMGPIDDFKGFPVYSSKAKERESVLLENLGKGPCDLPRKPILICVRTKRYKYMWREYISDNNEALQNTIQLYDLENDPYETNNLIGDKKYSNIANDLEKIAINRCNEIRNGNKD